MTKTTEIRNNHATDAPINIQENPIDTVQDFVYLGSLITPGGDSETDIDARIQKATRVFGMLTSVWTAIKQDQASNLHKYFPHRNSFYMEPSFGK